MQEKENRQEGRKRPGGKRPVSIAKGRRRSEDEEGAEDWRGT